MTLSRRGHWYRKNAGRPVIRTVTLDEATRAFIKLHFGTANFAYRRLYVALAGNASFDVFRRAYTGKPVTPETTAWISAALDRWGESVWDGTIARRKNIAVG